MILPKLKARIALMIQRGRAVLVRRLVTLVRYIGRDPGLMIEISDMMPPHLNLVIKVDCDGRILHVSRRCARSLGFRQDELIGRYFWSHLHVAEEVALVQRAFSSLPDASFPRLFLLRWLMRDGTERVLSWSNEVERDQLGHARGVTLVGRDLTSWIERVGITPLKMFEQIPAYIWAVDRDLRVTLSVGAGLTGIGIKTGQLVGMSLYDLTHIEDDQGERTIFRHKQALAGETVRYDGSWRGHTYESVLQPFRDGKGSITGAIGVGLDVTDRKRIEHDLEVALTREKEARQAAERLSRIKDEFLVMLSHELRTPLTPILGWIDVMRRESMSDEEAQMALEIIEHNAKSELRLVNDLLDMSSIMAGKMRMEAEAIDLGQVVTNAVQAISLAAKSKDISLEFIRDEHPCMVWGDRDRLLQVVWNLVVNAVKFTPKFGCIKVQLRSTASDAIVTVADSGIGIAQDFIAKVFERFTQADSSLTREYSGLGIGLAIARDLTEAHGGRLVAESPGIGMGATFTLSLPLKPVRCA